MILRIPDLERDVAALERLLADIEAHDRHPALGERKHFYILDPLLDTDGAMTGLVAEEGPRFVAYLAMMDEGGRSWTAEIAIHPEYRDPAVVDTLLEAVCGEVRGRGGQEIRLWVYVPALARCAEASGFVLERELLHMEAPLPLAESPRIPPGIEVRGFREGVDEEAWLEGNNRVFAGHPENGNWGIADLDLRRRRPWFSAEGIRMAWVGETLAGFCWTKVPSSQAGEIYVIGVLPEHQGLGLGKALLLEGIRHMHSHDQAKACVLYVDAANAPALNMYRAMGFSTHHTDRCYLFRPADSAGTDSEGTLSVELRTRT